METIRDSLALERTRLANERTFLAYVRTALSLLAGAAVLFQFFSGQALLVIVAWLLLVLGVLVLAIGLYRFHSVRAALNNDAQEEKPDGH